MAEKRDLVVSPGAYAYLRDGTKGTIKIYTGPTVVTPSAQDEGIVYDEKAGEFKPCAELAHAVRRSPVTVEGFYCVLLNPAKNRKQPEDGGQATGTELDVGRKINIPGPGIFALWPGQSAEVIRGHQLRYNQYLIARVYNEDEARKNWLKAVVKPASTDGATVDVAVSVPLPKDLSVGKLLIIRGTEVSFYIPPTGVSVVVEESEDGVPQYVREALTLERLEYAILLGENGEKRYVNGPTVVFPAPTERFMEAKADDGRVSRKFRAIELNELQGLHLKVIADYEEAGVKYKAGQELFITGRDTAIYYPREEVSAVKYDGKTKHFATAIPVGEGRYVMNRMTGVILTQKGPGMLLPDPRTEIIVRRVLSDQQSKDWYPGNGEALTYNQSLRTVLAQVPTTRGVPSEGDVSRGRVMKGGATKADAFANASSYMIADSSRVSKEQGYVGDEFVRASNFNQPRTLTLDTKYQGVPTVEVWTGYAAQVVSKTGDKRRVVKGPATVVLDYDESLEVMTLSTGKPKSTDNLLRTVFLRTDYNQITDVISVETLDYVPFNVKLGYRVSFEGDSGKWWAVENYVKYLCDTLRSVLRGAIKKMKFTDFRGNATEILQQLVLTSSTAPGETTRFFPENGMRITSVEVLAVDCLEANLDVTFRASALSAVKTAIELAQLARGLDFTREKQAIVVAETEARVMAETRKQELLVELAAAERKTALAKAVGDLQVIAANAEIAGATELLRDQAFDQELSRKKRAEDQVLAVKKTTQEMVLEAMSAETDSTVARFDAAKEGLAEIATAITNKNAAVEIAQALNIQRAIGGESFGDVVTKVLGGIGAFVPMLQQLAPNVVKK